MRKETLEVVRGSGNVFRDLGRKNADVLQLKAILAAEIVRTLDREALSVRAAHARTGVAAADFSRIRSADLGRFTIDRLMSIVDRLGSRMEVRIRFKPSTHPGRPASFKGTKSLTGALMKRTRLARRSPKAGMRAGI